MTEKTSSLETPRYQREEVIKALQKFVERGITHPDDLPPNDPEVLAANILLDAWTEQQEAIAQRKGTPEADLEYSFDRSTIFVDAGFSDPNYLDEVANDWLVQDLQDAEEAGLTEIAKKIQAKIVAADSLRLKLKKQKQELGLDRGTPTGK